MAGGLLPTLIVNIQAASGTNAQRYPGALDKKRPNIMTAVARKTQAAA
jgi:hypothetical protein